MTPEELDRILSSDDFLGPSPDFAGKVMASVRRAAADPPLRFPWVRFAAGLAGCVAAALGGAVLLEGLEPVLPALASFGAARETGIATAAVLASLAVASVPRLIARMQD